MLLVLLTNVILNETEMSAKQPKDEVEPTADAGGGLVSRTILIPHALALKTNDLKVGIVD